jgi:hypothetical protein
MLSARDSRLCTAHVEDGLKVTAIFTDKHRSGSTEALKHSADGDKRFGKTKESLGDNLGIGEQELHLLPVK